MNRRTNRWRLAFVFLLMALSCQAQTAPEYTISTVAGTGTAGTEGDSGQALAAQLNFPMGVAVDGTGNLLIADQINGRIRKVTPEGAISTVAGKLTRGFSGDGAAATSAELNNPTAVSFDASGNMFIADTRNHVIRKVVTGGTISKFAGTGVPGALSVENAVAIEESLETPIGVAVDRAGIVYFADTRNNRIRKVATDGKISTFLDSGAGLNFPQGLAFDPAGNLYVSDSHNHRVLKVTPGASVTVVAGNGLPGYSGDGGLATETMLNYPMGVAVDASGNLFIADSVNGRIRVVLENGRIATVAGDGSFGGGGDGGPALQAQFGFPHGIALGPLGRLYIADTQNNRIRLLTRVAEAGPAGLPSIKEGGVVSSASFGGSSAIAPGSWIEVYGTGLGSSSETTRLTIGGKAAELAYVSPNQVNARVPMDAALGRQQLVAATELGSSAPYEVTLQAPQPELLAPASFKVDGRQYVAAVLSDGAYALPAGALSHASRPARHGETITLIGAGFGAEAGSLQLFIGDKQAEVAYAGEAPGSPGLLQLDVVVPEMASRGSLPLTFTQNGVKGAQTLYTAVQ
ncbi:MAG: hypothetical protein JJE04_12775 [Acidobacteriia bacterium]|nr:hypothetical protein [Terriglobia bacterium]